MKITKLKNKIIIDNPIDFNVVQTLNCGQIFRYVIDGNCAKVFSANKMAHLTFSANKIEIETDNIEYFYEFFDLDTNYARIKNQLRKDGFLLPAVNFGYGIRILNNGLFEMLVSFIISANNNIARIKKSVEHLCEQFGTICKTKLNNEEFTYNAFPTLEQLKTATVDDFKAAGLGYRAEQLHFTIQQLTQEQLCDLCKMTTSQQFKFLVSLKGVGEKVANCTMLFGLGVKSVFPVDTWINKVYNNLMGRQETDRKKICLELTARYGELSGYAQQYAFYYYRDNNFN